MEQRRSTDEGGSASGQRRTEAQAEEAARRGDTKLFPQRAVTAGDAWLMGGASQRSRGVRRRDQLRVMSYKSAEKKKKKKKNARAGPSARGNSTWKLPDPNRLHRGDQAQSFVPVTEEERLGGSPKENIAATRTTCVGEQQHSRRETARKKRVVTPKNEGETPISMTQAKELYDLTINQQRARPKHDRGVPSRQGTSLSKNRGCHQTRTTNRRTARGNDPHQRQTIKRHRLPFDRTTSRTRSCTFMKGKSALTVPTVTKLYSPNRLLHRQSHAY